MAPFRREGFDTSSHIPETFAQVCRRLLSLRSIERGLVAMHVRYADLWKVHPQPAVVAPVARTDRKQSSAQLISRRSGHVVESYGRAPGP
jgi:hypothetical protein